MDTGGGTPRLRGIKCPGCRMLLPSPPGEGQPLQLTCIRCNAHLHVVPFPALHEKRVGKAPSDLLSDQESGCFYHPQKQAQTVCDHCGRFLCTLCDVQWHRQTLCPECITRGRMKRDPKHDLSSLRTRYDSQTLMLGLLPILLPPLWWVTWATSPMTIIMAVRHRNKPCSFLPGRRSRLRFTFGIIFAICQLGVIALLIVGLLALGGLSA